MFRLGLGGRLRGDGSSTLSGPVGSRCQRGGALHGTSDTALL